MTPYGVDKSIRRSVTAVLIDNRRRAVLREIRRNHVILYLGENRPDPPVGQFDFGGVSVHRNTASLFECPFRIGIYAVVVELVAVALIYHIHQNLWVYPIPFPVHIARNILAGLGLGLESILSSRPPSLGEVVILAYNKISLTLDYDERAGIGAESPLGVGNEICT